MGITHFVDDRMEVLYHLLPILECRFLFCPKLEGMEKYVKFLPEVHISHSWPELVEQILATTA
ncbi:MAG: hypothetical protein KW802_04255 [Candidatus Doudnabacteria bacterium]|nr:hypothetical protein [Candidatus Doudnabacteria bacterium]